MIRPQAKDMYQSGFDARMVAMDKKGKALQPPMNASPGELRLWRKLNGLLNEDEKKVDEFEHGKAKSRQHKYPGMRGPSTANRRPSESEQLYGSVENSRQSFSPAPGAAPAHKKSRLSTGGGGSNPSSPRAASPKGARPAAKTPAQRYVQ